MPTEFWTIIGTYTRTYKSDRVIKIRNQHSNVHDKPILVAKYAYCESNELLLRRQITKFIKKKRMRENS